MKVVKLPHSAEEVEPSAGVSEFERRQTLLSPRLVVCLGLILVLSLIARSYTIGLGLPYFYNEDEAHHFNRVVEMVQRGEYNPNYFHKPSLHFYLRMPVVAASFLWTVKKGHIKTVQDIRTRDVHGLSGYSLTASHPGIVKWNRALSVLFGLGVVLAAGLIAFLLTESSFAASIAALIAGVSPGMIEYGAVIGVDMPTAFFCSFAVLLLLVYQREQSLWPLVSGCILAGFAVSTKYNALPVALLPILAVAVSNGRSLPRLLISLLLPGVAFFAASPFIIASLPLFLNHFAYEIWHYGHAAHVGHSSSPGLGQAIFYGSWLVSDGIGPIALIGAALGALSLFKTPRLAIITLAFPLMYFALMISQKTHFERNMLMIMGVLPVLAAVSVHKIQETKVLGKVRPLLLATITIAILLPLTASSWSARKTAALESIDARNQAFQWINANTPPFTDTALQGELQLPLFQVFQGGIRKNSVNGVKRVSFDEYSIATLVQMGYERFVFGPEVSFDSVSQSLIQERKIFAGADTLGRIPKNPRVTVAGLSTMEPHEKLTFLSRAGISIPTVSDTCDTIEDSCWVQGKIARLETSSTNIEAFSPWGEQTIVVFSEDGKTLAQWKLNEEPQVFKVPAGSQELFLYTPEVHVPAHYSESSDTRRLGFAISKNRLP